MGWKGKYENKIVFTITDQYNVFWDIPSPPDIPDMQTYVDDTPRDGGNMLMKPQCLDSQTGIHP